MLGALRLWRKWSQGVLFVYSVCFGGFDVSSVDGKIGKGPQSCSDIGFGS